MTRSAHNSSAVGDRSEAGRPRRGLLGTLRAWITAEDAVPASKQPAPPAEAPPLAAIGIFGKHPAWDDFLPDLIAPPAAGGNDTLRNLRRTLIEQGVAANIESGTIDDWSDAERLTGFDHFFVGRPAVHDVGGRGAGGGGEASAGFVCGRIHDSVDGRGRTRYPLVLAAHVSSEASGGLPPLDAAQARREWCFERGLPGLANLHARLSSAGSKQVVTAHAGDAAAGLSRALDAQLPRCVPEPTATGEAALAQLDEYLGESAATGERAVFSVLYELNNRLACYSASSRRRTACPERPEHLRLPAGSMVTLEAMRLWAQMLLGELRRDADILLVAANDPDALLQGDAAEDGESWIDLIVGPAAPASTLCLFGSPARIPLATSVPFRFDPSFLLRARGRFGHRPEAEPAPFTDLPTGVPSAASTRPASQPSNTTFH